MLGTLVRTLFSRCILLLLMLVLAVPVMILLLLPERLRYDSSYVCWCKHIFYTLFLKGLLLPISIVGRENIPDEPAIIVANHQSSLDIPLIGSLVGLFPHVWLATRDLMASPILRWILPKATVLIDVSTPMHGMRSLVKAVNMIDKKRRHAIIFPEGSRYADGHIHDFYGGFVVLAKKTDRPVVPILIRDAYKVYPRGSFLLYYHPIQLVVGKPLWIEKDESDDHFKERIRSWFLEVGGS